MKSSYVFKYESGWMIVLYDGQINVKYFNIAEHDWDAALDYEALFNPEKRYVYELPTYSYVSKIDVFSLDGNPIEQLKEYLKQ